MQHKEMKVMHKTIIFCKNLSLPACIIMIRLTGLPFAQESSGSFFPRFNVVKVPPAVRGEGLEVLIRT